MMKKFQYILILAASLAFAASCKDPYMPNIDELKKDILVVEGFIDGAGATVVKLGYVQPMQGQDSALPRYINNAQVIVEDSEGGFFALTPSGNGSYTAYLWMNASYKYRLRVKLADQQEYLSAFVSYIPSPPIQDIFYRIVPDGAQFYVSTADDGVSRFFRWEYEETWQFHSYYFTDYKYDPVKKAVVDNDEDNHTCWQSKKSFSLHLKSTLGQGQGGIADMPMLLIPNGSYKLSDIYSLNIKQFSLDSAGYNYYRQLKKNTEETGSIFDPQPGNLKGNITCISDPTAIAVGYIGAGNSSQLRKYFRVPWNYREDCSDMVEVVDVKDSLDHYFRGKMYWPVARQSKGNETIWLGARTICVDCTVRGTNVKPPFWP